MKIYMARHAQTLYNANRCYYGKLDPGLTDLGKIQALHLSKRIVQLDLTFDWVIVSPLIRTKQTALLALCNQKPKQLQEINDFSERDFGDWEGLTADQVQQKDPANWQAFLQTPFEATPNRGEPFQQFKQRVIRGFESILGKKDMVETVLLVGHLGVLRIIVQEYFYPEKSFWEIDFEQGQLYEFEWK